jgi:hypothetical protein
VSVTGWKLPATATVEAGSGTWTNQNNVLADDGTEATLAIAAKNTTGRWVRGDDLGFDSAIPASAVITKVEIRAEWRVNNAGGIGILELQAFVGGVAVGAVRANSAEPTTLTTDTFDITADRTWTRANLLNASFDLKVRGRTGNNATDPSFRFDHIAAQVTYEEPATGPIAQALPTLTQDANGLHGTVATGPIAQVLPSLTQDANGERGPNTGPIASSLPSLTQDVTGTVEEPTTGAITSDLPGLTQQATGERGASQGPVVQTLPGLTQSATGERGASAGPVAQTLPALTQDATGERAANTGPIANVLPSLGQSAAGTHGDIASGSISSSLPSLTQVVTGTVEEPETPMGPVVSTLPGLGQLLEARAVVVGAMTSNLAALTQFATESDLGVPVQGPTSTRGPRGITHASGTAGRTQAVGSTLANSTIGGGTTNEAEG